MDGKATPYEYRRNTSILGSSDFEIVSGNDDILLHLHCGQSNELTFAQRVAGLGDSLEENIFILFIYFKHYPTMAIFAAICFIISTKIFCSLISFHVKITIYILCFHLNKKRKTHIMCFVIKYYLFALKF